ncbi:prepilin peptidase [Leptotrichia sp. oral taxon 417]|uniref:prepilin peptidase n=1 Tax=Leptotrichia sp. oral taxon 417 TaxID=712365 RepID=UPI0015BD3D86|nr:prepilin peptidase [Leptotrichia sp. oral taxon 417]NWO26791.1 prepilin peptidase [Leptotrichia sp. oral taxon 417]
MNWEIVNNIIEVVKYCIFFRIIWVDVKKRIIPEESAVILIILGLITAVQNDNFEKYYLGICAYSMPMIVLYILEDYFGKMLIGFGDVKLMMGIGGLLGYFEIEKVLNFYMILYIFSGIIAFLFLFLKKWKKYEYIPFAPFIVISYVIFRIFNK